MRTILTVLFFVSSILAQDADWQTYYEKSNFKKTPRYAETIAFAKKLAAASPMISYSSFGKSPQGRDLPLLIIDKNGNSTFDQVRKTNNVVFLIQAGIHSGEIDGKDAGFMLIRDMVIKNKDLDLLDNVTLLFMPIFNVDGHERFSAYSRANQNGPEEMGWRTTAQNYNLNRDYLKADAPEMQAWLKLYNEWLPEFFADCHVTDGADYQYTITYSIDLVGRIAQNLIAWTVKNYLPPLKSAMLKQGLPLIEYVSFKNWGDPASGMEGGSARPRYSNGYTSIQNRPGLLIETHMFKDYKSRVDATYHILKETIRILNQEHMLLNEEIQKADNYTQSKDFRKKPYALTYKEVKDSTMIKFLGYKYTIEKSALSGGDWVRYTQDTVTTKIAYYNMYEADILTDLPEAYIIPPEWTAVIERLDLHGIKYQRLQAPQTITVKSYRFFNEKWAERPYENHHTLTFEQEYIEAEREYPIGSVVIPMDQPTAKVIAHIIEPQAPDSYLLWGFFDSIFERKEYVESYVMEERARAMLASDPELKKAFEQKKKNDPEFAANPDKILGWFFKQSPYWDTRINIYPVGKIFDADVLAGLNVK